MTIFKLKKNAVLVGKKTRRNYESSSSSSSYSTGDSFCAEKAERNRRERE